MLLFTVGEERGVTETSGVVRRVLALGLAAVTLAGCGAADDVAAPSVAPSVAPTGDAETTTAVTTTSAAPETPTPSPVPTNPPADAATLALADDAVLLATDFGDAWTLHTEGETLSAPVDDCAYVEGGALSRLGDGAYQAGPIMQFGSEIAYITSRAAVFPDEAAAMQFTSVLSSDAWGACQTEDLNDFQAANETGLTATLDTREREGLGENTLESYALLTLADGDDAEAEAYQEMDAYRYGRVVVVVFTEAAYLEDAQATAFVDASYEALLVNFDRLNTSSGGL